MPARGTLLRLLGIGVLGALYYGLSHLLTAADRPSSGGAALSLAPWLAVALAIAWRARRRRVALAGWVAGVATLMLIWPLLRENFSWLYLAQHAGSFVLLAIGFGQTLLAGETPMISRFAARIHGGLPEALARYTRGATLAWSLFFVAMAAISLLLFFFAPIAWWSAFANLLTPPLIGAMFLAEYAVRRIRLPREVQTGLVESIRAIFAAPPPGTESELRPAGSGVR